jgi:hypothetical protein
MTARHRRSPRIGRAADSADDPDTAVGHDFSLALRPVRQAAAETDIVVVAIHRGVELFVWLRLSDEGATTGVAEVTVTPTGRLRGRLLPVEIVPDGHPVLR